MTISDIIAMSRQVASHNVNDQQVIDWLDALDDQIFKDVILTHEDNRLEEREEYDSVDCELIAPKSNAEMYIYYIDTMVYAQNGDEQRYNISAALFNTAYFKFTSWYNRVHKPLSKQFKW